MRTPTESLSSAGVSIWLDDLSRTRIESGDLARLIDERNVVGVTTNPTIFQNAITAGIGYEESLEQQARAGASVDEAIFALTTADVRDACDLLRPVYDRTNGVDGRVSIEVSPDLAHDTAGTITQARELYDAVGRENVMIKIPATKAGLPAITAVIGSGISVNVTLIFSLERYDEVIAAYLEGLAYARRTGIDLRAIHSVASFFVSRVDQEVDARLIRCGALAARSQAGLANARLAYELFERRFASHKAAEILASGGNVQRPLWASTGVKDPSLPDTLYVASLVAPNAVNTMPEQTLEAMFDHGVVSGDTITCSYDDARRVFAELAAAGIDFSDVTQQLETEGVEKFIASWHDLQNTVRAALIPAASGTR